MPDLDPDRLGKFARLIRLHPNRTLRDEELWRIFADAFPGRPQAAEECRWLREALERMEERGVVDLPPRHGQRWEELYGVKMPRSVDVIHTSHPTEQSEERRVAWHPKLSWVPNLEHRLSDGQMSFLRRVQEGFKEGWFDRSAPMKYRSLQLTGDEKRLRGLQRTSLFKEGRLDLDMLGCLPDVAPLAWERVGEKRSLLVFENAGPFAVARRVLNGLGTPPYGLIAYGGGRGFVSSVAYLADIDADIGSIHYVGDLDLQGLRIPLDVRKTAEKSDLPRIQPATELHEAMFASAKRLGHPEGWQSGAECDFGKARDAVTFLASPLEERACQMIQTGRRIPEEVLGPEELAETWIH